ncbi:MAG: HAD-IIB family hydrolase [Magnetococcales bacterium]|nr:HAD-IIB family hydrolase [Magnetococcales bacterium]
MAPRFLLCTDLDRTLLPNGPEAETPGVRQRFAALVNLPEIILAYVSGRDRDKMEQVVAEYALPRPDWAITDVGATLWNIDEGAWKRDRGWETHLAGQWHPGDRESLARRLEGITPLELQEENRQGRFKLSYYIPPLADPEPLLTTLRERLDPVGIGYHLIASTDEVLQLGFLDVMPPDGSKHGAVEFLRTRERFDPDRVLFAGDSGNDLDLLASPIPAVLVANAEASVRHRVVTKARSNNTLSALCLASGRFGMNGCYAAGILEGLAHFHPEYIPWITTE